MREKRIKVQLRAYLESVGLSAYSLAQWVESASPKTIYAVANGSRRPSLELLEAILTALHKHGYQATLEDLLTLEDV